MLTPREQRRYDMLNHEIHISKNTPSLEDIEARDYAKAVRRRERIMKKVNEIKLPKKIQAISKTSLSNPLGYILEAELSEQDIEREVEY